MTAAEIIARAREDLDERDPDNSHWDDVRMLSFLNEGQDDLILKVPGPLLPALNELEEQNLAIGQYLYALPADWCKTISLKLYDKFALVLTSDFEYAVENNSCYEPSLTHPVALEPYYQGKTKIFPVPASLMIDGLKRIYIRMPAKITAVGQTPEIPVYFHEALVLFLVYRSMAEDGDGRAVSVYQEYIAALGGKSGTQ